MRDSRVTVVRPHPDNAKKSSPWRAAVRWLGILMLVMVCAGAGAAIYLNGKFYGANSPEELLVAIRETTTAIRDPRKFFPGRDRITVLCLGLDRNIVQSRDPRINGMPSTKNARTDVMMLASLDLNTGRAAILSLPRDTRVRLPRRRGYAKINQAHADGGIPYTIEAVEEFLGIKIDHHVVIKQEVIEAVVDEIGGLHVNVEKDMDYDDFWGKLHIHLKKGPQVLDGNQVVGYIRFRKDAEGDFGRIRRQQQVINVMAQQLQSPQILPKAANLIETLKRYIKTDLTPQQQLALAHVFHRMDSQHIQTVALPVADTATIDGISYVIPDEFGKEAAVEWAVYGNDDAMNRLIRVHVRNASGDRKLYNQVTDCLRHFGFQVSYGGSVSGETATTTHAFQESNMNGAARRVLSVLGVRGTVEKLEEVSRSRDVTLVIGADMSNSRIVFAPELWPEPPQRPRRRTRILDDYQRSNASARVRIREREPEPDPVEVEIEPVAPDAEPSPSPDNMQFDLPVDNTAEKPITKQQSQGEPDAGAFAPLETQ